MKDTGYCGREMLQTSLQAIRNVVVSLAALIPTNREKREQEDKGLPNQHPERTLLLGK